MKVRKGFVSNSSSTSFVCDICECVETGYDEQYNIAIAHCMGHAHDMCERCVPVPEGKSYKELTEYDEDWGGDSLPSELCPLCNLTDISDDLVLKYVLRSTLYTKESAKEEIKQNYKDLYEFLRAMENEN